MSIRASRGAAFGDLDNDGDTDVIVGNAAAAAAMALAAGLDLDAVADSLGDALPASRWRMEVTERADGVVVINLSGRGDKDVLSAQKALDAVALGMLDDHVRHCVLGSSGPTQAARTDELMAAVGRLVKS